VLQILNAPVKSFHRVAGFLLRLIVFALLLIKKTRIPKCILVFLGWVMGLIAFSLCEKKGSAPSSRRRQRSSALHLMVRVPLSRKEREKSHPIRDDFFSFWGG